LSENNNADLRKAYKRKQNCVGKIWQGRVL